MKKESEKKRSFVYICLLAGLILLAASCSRKLVETQIETQGLSGRILIAGDSSEFKDAVRNRVIKEFQADYGIDVINIDRLSKTNSAGYSVVLIMDTCMAWSGFNPSLKSFIDKAENMDKTVLFMTAGDPDWNYSYLGVDAITAASEIENENTAFGRIKSEINTILIKHQ